MLRFRNDVQLIVTFDQIRYRFVWAGHTLNVFRLIREQADENMVEDSEGQSGVDAMEEVIDKDDLGILGSPIREGDEEEEEEEEEGMEEEEEEKVIPVVKNKRKSGPVRRIPPSEKMEEEGVNFNEGEEIHEDEEEEEGKEGQGDEGDPMVDMPKVVSVFFAHPAIRRSIDAAEGQFFEKFEELEKDLAKPQIAAPILLSNHNGDNNNPFGIGDSASGGSSMNEKTEVDEMEMVWGVEEVVEAFVKLVDTRNKDLKVSDAPDKQAIMRDVTKLYIKRFLPFLQSLGITTLYSGDTQHLIDKLKEKEKEKETKKKKEKEKEKETEATGLFEWRWKAGANRDFVHQMYVTLFRNITLDGTSPCSRYLVDLLPELFVKADSHVESTIPQVNNPFFPPPATLFSF